MKKNNSIEFLRIIFIICVCIHHYLNAIGYEVNYSLYLAVEFFFILSGYLTMNHFVNKNNDSPIQYILKKVKNLYIDYAIALFVTFLGFNLMDIIQNNFNPIERILKLIPEIFLVQNIGIFDGGINYPLWYVSVLIFSSYIIYSLLKYNEKLSIQIVFPLILVISYTLIFKNGDSLENWSTVGILYLPLIRGIADMILGIYAFLFAQYFEFPKKYIKIYTIIELMLILLILVILFNNNYDKYILILLMSLIICFFKKIGKISQILDLSIMSKLSKIVYPMYVNHLTIILIMKIISLKIKININISILIYFGLLIVYSMMSLQLVNLIKKRISKGVV